MACALKALLHELCGMDYHKKVEVPLHFTSTLCLGDNRVFITEQHLYIVEHWYPCMTNSFSLIVYFSHTHYLCSASHQRSSNSQTVDNKRGARTGRQNAPLTCVIGTDLLPSLNVVTPHRSSVQYNLLCRMKLKNTLNVILFSVAVLN